MKRVAVIASGGDAVGINSALLPLVQQKQLSILAFHGGYDGIIKQPAFTLTEMEVRGAVSSGRNLLRSARSELAWLAQGRRLIRQRLAELAVELLVVFGGGGSLRAARQLDSEGLPTLVLPMTIDNDIDGTDYTLGFASALQVVTQALDQLHDTAHNMAGRIYMLEAFGADTGHIALSGALAGGAHAVVLPELATDRQWLAERLRGCLAEPFGYGILVCAEGMATQQAYLAGSQGASIGLGRALEERLEVPVRHTLPGYCHRGGTPVTQDRLAAAEFGRLALEAIVTGRHGVLVGLKQGQGIYIDLQHVKESKRELDPRLLNAARNLNMIN